MLSMKPIFTLHSLIPKLILLLLLVVVSPVAAQTGIQSTAIVNFPQEVTFTLQLPPDHDVIAATLTYDVERLSCIDAAAHVPVELSGSGAEWTWVMTRSGNPPPGTTLWWEWTLTHADGTITTTDRQTVVLEDGRFPWQTLTDGNITLHWYKGDKVGPMLLDAAVAGLNQLEGEMGIDIQTSVTFYIYGSSADMREAVLYIQNWAGGVAFSDYGTILIGVPPEIAADWGVSTVRHELAHLVLGQYGLSCVGGRRPTWLEEGLATYAEGVPSQRVRSDIANAIANDSFEPLRSLNGAFPADDNRASVAYSQSYSVVDFMYRTYGAEAMQRFIQELAAGADYDSALMTVYGVNMDGLEQAWRADLGLPPREIPPTPTPLTAAVIPTIALQAVPRTVATPPSANEPPPAQPVRPGICGLGLLPLFLLTAVAIPRSKARGTG